MQIIGVLKGKDKEKGAETYLKKYIYFGKK